jgi:hypothetical protein
MARAAVTTVLVLTMVPCGVMSADADSVGPHHTGSPRVDSEATNKDEKRTWTVSAQLLA